MKVRLCKDCQAEDRPGKPLDAPYAGPRCFRHHHIHKRAQKTQRAAYQLTARYQLTPEQYQAVLEVQGGGCAICGRKPSKTGRRLAVDHDHSCCPGRETCGECTRGLLCWSCNKFLEHIRDDPETAQRAANYMQNPPATLVLNAQAV